MKKHVIALLSLCIMSAMSFGQGSHWEFDLSLAGGFPAGEFKDALDDEGYGVGIRVARWLGDSPLSLGVDLTFLEYGDNTFDSPFDSPYLDEIEYLKTSNNIIMGHLSLRWQKKRGPIRPYIEGLVGLKHFETKTEVYHYDYDEPLDSDTEYDDSGFSVGCGVGAAITLRDGGMGPHRRPSVFLRGGCRYLHGEKASYVPEDSIEYDGQVLSYTVVTSRTDMIMADLGVSIKF